MAAGAFDCNKWVIGQKELVKTAVVVEISTAIAVISFLKEDTGWTKRVGKNACSPWNLKVHWGYIFLRNSILGGL